MVPAYLLWIASAALLAMAAFAGWLHGAARRADDAAVRAREEFGAAISASTDVARALSEQNRELRAGSLLILQHLDDWLADPRVDLSEANVRLVREICVELGRMPGSDSVKQDLRKFGARLDVLVGACVCRKEPKPCS